MRMESVFRVLFVFYCLEAGVFLLLAPWSPAWDRNFVQLPYDAARDVLLQSWFRGAVSGFGAVHILWAFHDCEQWWTRRRARPTAELS